MRSAPFISDEREFLDAKRTVDSLFVAENRLPSSPFKVCASNFRFEEFTWAMTDEFWSHLQALARGSGDPDVILAVIEPDPVTYFKRHFDDFAWGLLSIELGGDDYWSFINEAPRGNPADSILSNGRVVVWTVPSRAWAIWGEYSSGLVILSSGDPSVVRDWKDLSWARDIASFERGATFGEAIHCRFK